MSKTIENPNAEAVDLDRLVRHLQDEIAFVEKRRSSLSLFLKFNSQYQRNHAATMKFYDDQIKRLKSFLPNSELDHK